MNDDDARDLETDVLVIGGGLAGLSCAVGLRDSGLRVTLVERDRRLGGRAASWTDARTGDPVHIGPHIFMSEYPNIFRLLDLLGTRDKIVWQRSRFITLVEGSRRMVFRMSALPPPLHFMTSSRVDGAVGPLDLASNLPIALCGMQLTEEHVLRLDGINALAFLRSMGVSRRSIDRFWAFVCMSILNLPLELCSAAALMRFYRLMIGHNGFCIGFPDGGLGDLFAPPGRALLEAAGVRVLLDTPARRLTGEGARATGAELADGRRIRARRVVAALPPQAVRALLPLRWREAHQTFRDLVAFQPCPYVSVQVWFDRKVSDVPFWARVHSPTDLNCDFYDLSLINRGWRERPSVVASNIIYSHRAADLSDEEVVAETVRELRENMPDARPAEVVHSVVNRIPMAIHCPFPGTERRRPAIQSPIGGLLLAGDWTRTGLPSSMESAARSGWLAAEQLLAEVGRPARLAATLRETEGFAGLIRRASQLLPFVEPLPRHVRRLAS